MEAAFFAVLRAAIRFQMAEFHRTNYLSQDHSENRYVFLHYHIFKNAGTSVDSILRECFGEAFMSVDGPVPEFFINQTEVAVMTRNRAQVKALSSHQIRLPVPQERRIAYLPIIFLRRPELRMKSMWRFQRSRNDSHPATLLAQQLEFPEWIEFNLRERRKASMLNQQALLCSFQYDQRTPVNHPDILARAIRNVRALPFVGIVEEFEASMKIYQRLYRSLVPEFEIDQLPQLNRSSNEDLPMQEQTASIEKELGSSLFAELSECMHLDLDLYQFCLDALRSRQRDRHDETG